MEFLSFRAFPLIDSIIWFQIWCLTDFHLIHIDNFPYNSMYAISYMVQDFLPWRFRKAGKVWCGGARVSKLLISKKDAPKFLLSNPCIYRHIRLSLKYSSFPVIFTKWSPGTFSGKNQVLSNPSRFIMLPDDRSSRLPIFSQISAALPKETFSNKMWYFLSLKIETEFVGT